MVTDSEKRELASKLRKLKLEDPTHGYISWSQIALTINPKGGTFDELPDMLADLIEPSCDRDSLLTLADNMYEYADFAAGLGGSISVGDLLIFADCIRDALGVNDE